MRKHPTVGIIGVGLIGGSIGLRARELGWHAIGFDVNPDAVREAAACDAIDETVKHDDVYGRADTIVIATPPRATIAELATICEKKPRAQLIIDVASVKEPIVTAASGLENFVATHPLAGSELSGAAAADAELFAGKPWIYVPPQDAALEGRAQEFIAAMGARAVEASAQEHDALLALSSHLPQLFAMLFSSTLHERNDARIEAYCGPVANELLRLGNSNAALWREIFAYNGKNVAASARELAMRLNAAAQALDAGRFGSLVKEAGGKES